MVLGPNYGSQNGRSLHRDPYYSRDPHYEEFEEYWLAVKEVK